MTDLPLTGLARDALVDELRARKAHDADWHGGRTWSLVYHADDEVAAVARAAAELFLFENALSPFAFPSLRNMEAEVVGWTAGLLNGPEAAGTMTSGGSESIFLAVKSARDRSGIAGGEVVLPITAHPAFEKAAHYLGLRTVHAPTGPDHRVDVDAVAALISDRTVLVVGSAPCYPFGVIDPIPDLAALAVDRGVAMHVDACLGGFFLPFWERLGRPVPHLWDFRVPGVSTISADAHKYGYAIKGASVLLHASRDLRRHQFFRYDDWPGGLYASPTAAGTRPAPPIAVAWAVMRHLGVEGYVRLAATVADTFDELRAGIAATAGLTVVGEPDIGVFCFTSSDADLDIAAVGDAMDARGWHLDRQPAGLHLMVTPNHARVVDEFLADLDAAAGDARGKAAEGKAQRYGAADDEGPVEVAG